jgi:hypothetical protein
VGLILGLITWFTASHLLASSILWVENRYPKLAGSLSLRAYEMVMCGLLVLSCFAVAVWIMRVLAK